VKSRLGGRTWRCDGYTDASRDEPEALRDSFVFELATVPSASSEELVNCNRLNGDMTMKALVVYDSKFGNTERIARVIAEALATGEPVPVMQTNETSERDLVGIDLLVVGGPTQAHGLSSALRTFLDHLSPKAVRDVATATFDTRLHWPQILNGSAAVASARRLETMGAVIMVPPESFLISGRKGLLIKGELERAKAWADKVRAAAGAADREPVAATR
jgi:flavodoxin I